MGFKEHGLMLFLGPELYCGFIKYQAQKELGRSYAGLRIFVEGLYHVGEMSREDYERFCAKYEQGLTKEQPLTVKQLQAKNEADEMAKKFSMVLDQWSLHPDPEWRKRWLSEAEAWKDRVDNAKLVLALAKGKGS